MNVMDLNDNAPVFDPLSYNAEVREDAPLNTSLLTVHATDLDSGEFISTSLHYQRLAR